MRLHEFVPRLTATALLFLTLLPLLACNTAFYISADTTGLPPNIVFFTGTVSFVGLTVISGENGTFVNVTAVTLLVPMGSSTMTFCGDKRSSFPANKSVRVGYTPGPNCSNLVNVTAT